MAGGTSRDGTMPGTKSRATNGTFAFRLAAFSCQHDEPPTTTSELAHKSSEAAYIASMYG